VAPFYELIQLAIGTRASFSIPPDSTQWESLYQQATKHDLIGITYAAVVELPKQQQPDMQLLLQWSEKAKQIKVRNAHVNEQCSQLVEHFREAGFQAIILNGQNHLPNYPEHLRELRVPGNIDIWVKGKSKKQVYQFVRKEYPNEKYGYLHIHYPFFSDTSVEVHIRPAFLYNPFRNHYLQRWADSLDLNALTDPVEFRNFNNVYQPLYLYRHLKSEGITLRQLLDFYFLLKQHPSYDIPMLDKLSLILFYQDLTAVALYLFEGQSLPTVSSQKLLDEILTCGNTDSDLAFCSLQSCSNLSRLYPDESIYRPCFLLFQKVWRLFH